MEPALKAEVGDGLDFETQFLSYSRFEKYSFKVRSRVSSKKILKDLMVLLQIFTTSDT